MPRVACAFEDLGQGSTVFKGDLQLISSETTGQATEFYSGLSILPFSVLSRQLVASVQISGSYWTFIMNNVSGLRIILVENRSWPRCQRLFRLLSHPLVGFDGERLRRLS